MTRNLQSIGSLLGFCMMLQTSAAWAQPNEFSFGVIASGSAKSANQSGLARAIAETDADNLAFVVANGIKSGDEACSDKLYAERKTLLDEAKNGVILSLAASDWAACKKSDGKSAAVERLSRLRELFFKDEFSLGSTRIPVARQSSTPKFRSYSENTRWELDNILFATINLPANNNHYLAEAGRNSEFEDRLIANQDWLQRVFMIAIHKKLDGLVLFSDGNPFLAAGSENSRSKRDGFAETRQQIARLAAKFPGKVLIVTAQKGGAPSAANRIIWRNNIGILETGSGLARITSDPTASRLFSVSGESGMAKNARR